MNDEIAPHIPDILCTGYSDKISKEKATAMGIDGFLMKLVDRADLARALWRVLEE